jgi:hypothetical protein
MTAFWNTAPCSLTAVEQRFRGVYCLHHQVIAHHVWTPFYFETTRGYIPESYHLHTHHLENLKYLISDNWTPNHQLPEQMYQSTRHSTWRETFRSASIDSLTMWNKKTIRIFSSLPFFSLFCTMVTKITKFYAVLCLWPLSMRYVTMLFPISRRFQTRDILALLELHYEMEPNSIFIIRFSFHHNEQYC